MANLSDSLSEMSLTYIHCDGLETSGLPLLARAEHLSWCGRSRFLLQSHSRTALVPFWRVWLGLSLRGAHPTPRQSRHSPELKCKPHSPPSCVRLLCAPLRGLPRSPPVGLAWLWNERYAVKQDRSKLSLAQGGRGAQRAGWGPGPHLPSWRLELVCTASITSSKTPANFMPNACFLPPTSGTPSPQEATGGGRGGSRKTKGGEGRRFWRKLSGGAPWCGKLHILKSQLSGSEETGDINPSLSLRLCPSLLQLSLSPRILGQCKGHVASVEGRKGVGSGQLCRQRRTPCQRGGNRTQSRREPCVTPTSGTEGTCPSFHTDTEVPKSKPNFIYTHPKVHDLGL